MQAPDVLMTPDASDTKHDRRLASLDGLRGLAALSVFSFHVWLYTMSKPAATDRSSFGDYAAHELRLGLVLFFVLSGFLLSGFLLSRPWFAAALDGRGLPAAAPRGRVIGGPLLTGMGTISYGFYLWHVPVLMFLRGNGLLPLDPALGVLVALVPALAISALSRFAIERPIIAWAARRNRRAREAARRSSGSGGVDRRATRGGREVSTVRA